MTCSLSCYRLQLIPASYPYAGHDLIIMLVQGTIYMLSSSYLAKRERTDGGAGGGGINEYTY